MALQRTTFKINGRTHELDVTPEVLAAFEAVADHERRVAALPRTSWRRTGIRLGRCLLRVSTPRDY